MLPEQAARIRHQANVDDAVRQLRAVQVQRRRFMRVGGEGRMFRTCDQCLQPLQQQRPLRARTILQAFQRLLEQVFAAAGGQLHAQRIEQVRRVARKRQLVGFHGDRGDQERGGFGLESICQWQGLFGAELCDGVGEFIRQRGRRGRVLQVAAHRLRIADAFQPPGFGSRLRMPPERGGQCARVGRMHQRTRRAIEWHHRAQDQRGIVVVDAFLVAVTIACGGEFAHARGECIRIADQPFEGLGVQAVAALQRGVQQLSGQVFAAIQVRRFRFQGDLPERA